MSSESPTFDFLEREFSNLNPIIVDESQVPTGLYLVSSDWDFTKENGLIIDGNLLIGLNGMDLIALSGKLYDLIKKISDNEHLELDISLLEMFSNTEESIFEHEASHLKFTYDLFTDFFRDFEVEFQCYAGILFYKREQKLFMRFTFWLPEAGLSPKQNALSFLAPKFPSEGDYYNLNAYMLELEKDWEEGEINEILSVMKAKPANSVRDRVVEIWNTKLKNNLFSS